MLAVQVLAEYKQKHEFNALLKRYEEKPACEGRSLETFLTYPMHQVSWNGQVEVVVSFGDGGVGGDDGLVVVCVRL